MNVSLALLISATSLSSNFANAQATQTDHISERIWADHELGRERFGRNYDHATGYNFTPLVDGTIVALGGNFDGYNRVKLFHRATGNLLAETYVQSSGQWSYSGIQPVDVEAGIQYTVAAYISGPGGSSISNRAERFPLVHGNVQVDGRTYTRIRNNPEVRPTNNSLINIVHGRADAQFVPSEEEPEPIDNSYKLKLGSDFTVMRSGEIGDDLTWHIEKDGARVLQRNASGELRYRYFSNTIGSNIRIWLLEFVDGSYQRVSNIVEYTPGITDQFELELGSDFELSRSGVLGDALTWVIEKDGQVVLERNASNELSYTYFLNVDQSKYRVWLKQFVDGQYQVVSNIIEYEVGQTEFELSVDQQFKLHRDGQLGDQIQWVVEKDGQIVLERLASNELDYTYFNNAAGSSFRVWLKMFVNGEYEVVSNIVSYDVPASFDFELTLGSDFTVSRSGALGDNVNWLVVKDGNVVLQRNAANEISYRYFSNTPGSNISVYLQQFRGGMYVPVSNTVTYNP